MPKISVIIAVYNVEKYLRQCLDSVVNQTLKDIEIICIDDGSTDNSGEILDEYAAKDDRIKVIHQKNQGLACSRNNALKITTGEYILCVDSDDYIRRDTLELLYNRTMENDLDMLSFGGTNFDNETKEILENPYYEFRYLPEGFNINCFNYKDCIDFITNIAVSSCLTMYKHSFLKSHDIVFPPHLCFEDNVFFCKALMNAQRCGILKDTLYFRRIHSQSITQNWAKNHLDFVKVAGLVLDYLKSINVSNEIYEKYRIAYSDTVINNYNHFQNKYRKIYYKAIKSFAEKYSPDYIKKINKPDSISKYIFSVRNEDIRKVITIFGIKLKFKSKKLIERKRIANMIDKIDKQENDFASLINKIEEQENKIYNQIKIKNENKILSFRTIQNLSDLIRNKISMLPEDIDLVVGIPRSGVIPAYLIALFLNKKACTINEFINNLEPLNGYTRPVTENKKNEKQKVLIVDDSTYSGKSMDDAKELISKHKDLNNYDIKYCAIFALEESKDKVDYYFEIVPSPRMFQWNYLNHSNAKISCFDMDGVLCVDPTDEQNDDGEKYINFIINAKPLYIPQFKINSIVTSRLEKYRPQTEQWLKEHNVQYENLYMLELSTAEERRKLNCHAEFKAKIYSEKEDCNYFIESNRLQAKKNCTNNR